MPSTTPTLSGDTARAAAAGLGFDRPPTVDSPRRQVGIELEWLAVHADDPSVPASLEATTAAAAAGPPLPGGSRLTFEPGGQVELSSPPLPLLAACEVTARDAASLGVVLADAGISLVAVGLEPGPRRARAVLTPRYDAMEAYFDSHGTAGRTMMRSTAALQVNLDLGAGDEVETRWRAAHAVGPVLAAAFANSPIGPDGPTGFRSTRLAVWDDVDPCRTGVVNGHVTGRDSWAEYAMEARVMLVRTSPDDYVPVLEPFTFGDWIERGHALGWPTIDDLEYHLTTLFPPIRPRGWLELRMLDSVPDPWWRVATAVSAVLIQDRDAAAVLEPDLRGVRDRWATAARDGLSDPVLGAAARACFDVALDAMRAGVADPTTIAATERFVDDYVRRGRGPADDRLDEWAAGLDPMPEPDNRPLSGVGDPWA
ncbi:MAG: glutamate-cysteine ligase family protein [Acidimicrobiia bacterium]